MTLTNLSNSVLFVNNANMTLQHLLGYFSPSRSHNIFLKHVFMNFIEGFMVVDRLSKLAHFMTLSHPYTTIDVA